jgi:hypothetical protein
VFPLLVSLSFAADPALLPLSVDTVVGDHVGRVGVVGNGSTLGSVDGMLFGEVAIASRLAVQAEIGTALGVNAPLYGFQARVEILDYEDSPIGVAAAVSYEKFGFDGVDSEIEARVSLGLRPGRTMVLLNLVGGSDVAEPEGDVEASAALLHSLGRLVRLGGDAQGRFAVGDAGEEHEVEGEEERRGFDTQAGALLTIGEKRLQGYGFAGAEVIGGREGVRGGAKLSLGLQVLL